MKAKVGDYITVVDGPSTALVQCTGKSATVLRVKDDRVWVKAKELVPDWQETDEFYVLHGCYEIHPISGSPLWEALK